VGFTVYRGHPYCEACHVRLRLPKCKRCKRSIRDGDEAVEALGGKWCWGCFVCAVSVCFFFLSCFLGLWLCGGGSISFWAVWIGCRLLIFFPHVDRVVRNPSRTRRSSREGTSLIASRALASSCEMRSDFGTPTSFCWISTSVMVNAYASGACGCFLITSESFESGTG
jgi:hypothetical protein